MSFRSGSYAPVHEARIDRGSAAQDMIHGFAAPSRGPVPCRVELVAAERVMSVADACCFSEAAWATGVRFGWCGFRIGGLSTAGALGERVYLRCAVSGSFIEELDPVTTSPAQVKKPELSVLELRKFIGDMFGCSELDHIAPFAEWYRNRHGDYAFVEASYTYLHNRKPKHLEVNDFLVGLPESWTIAECWQAIIDSPEYVERRNMVLPGVFSPGFSFGLDLFD